jgi:hypothetical protein
MLRDIYNLNRHEKRCCKTREKPNIECTYCDKIFKYKKSLDRHHKKCEARRYEIEMLHKKLEEKYSELEKKYEDLKIEYKQLEMKYQDTQSPDDADVNAYNKPDCPDSVPVSQISRITSYSSISKFLFDYIWFNPDYPQNHSIKPVNILKQELKVCEGNGIFVRKKAIEIINIINGIITNPEFSDKIFAHIEYREENSEHLKEMFSIHDNCLDWLDEEDLLSKKVK